MSCPDCFSGAIVTNLDATGTETTIHGLPTYVARPADGVTPRGIIVFITDSFGWTFENNRWLCDRYAEKGGFLVYCPDFMNGNAMDTRVIGLMDKMMNPDSSWSPEYLKDLQTQVMTLVLPWQQNTAIPDTHPSVLAFMQGIRTAEPPFPTKDLKVGIAGFCWGGKHAILLAQDQPSSRVGRHASQTADAGKLPLVDCVFTAHPSFLSMPQDIEAVVAPLSVTVGSKDNQVKEEAANQMTGILKGKSEGSGRHEVTIKAGAKHGFAIRNHPEDELESKCAEEAEAQALAWFGRWMGGS